MTREGIPHHYTKVTRLLVCSKFRHSHLHVLWFTYGSRSRQSYSRCNIENRKFARVV